MIYGVVCGIYSDWDIKGYFNTRDEAEKFCVSKQDKDYYIVPIKSLTLNEKDENIKVYKFQEVVFNYKENGKFEMRDEPYRYTISDTFNKDKIIKYSNNRVAWINWIAFFLSDDDRKHAEKICQDLMVIIMNEYIQCKDINKALNIINNWKIIK